MFAQAAPVSLPTPQIEWPSRVLAMSPAVQLVAPGLTTQVVAVAPAPVAVAATPVRRPHAVSGTSARRTQRVVRANDEEFPIPVPAMMRVSPSVTVPLEPVNPIGGEGHL